MSQNPLTDYPILAEMRQEIEKQLRQTIRSDFPESVAGLRHMMEYHFGWLDGSASGKRLRPLFLLLACHTVGGDWRQALPAAAAVELIHNFSLIHDDIQDGSETRHNRPTLWTQVGVAQAINAGDAMFTAGLKKIWELETIYPVELVRRCSAILQQTCLSLTRGQFLDISFEDQETVTEEEYLTMITGKTTSLIAACLQIGALLGTNDLRTAVEYTRYGTNLGLAFQIVDDFLGIWGKPEVTGKSAATDLISRKKSYPVVLGLTEVEEFRLIWQDEPDLTDRSDDLARILDEAGIKSRTIEKADEFTRQAREALALALPPGESLTMMETLTSWLLTRDV
jgi:geranylgeranyl diphosphate synthase, type I